MVVADEQDMQELERNLGSTCDDYIANYQKLTGLINDIRGGVFQGEAADDFVKKYEAKEEIFKAVYEAVNKAKDYINNQRGRLNATMDELMSGMN